MRQGDPNKGKTQPANDTVNTGVGNKEKRKYECDLPNTSTAQETNTQDTTNNTREINLMSSHTEEKGKQEEGRAE